MNSLQIFKIVSNGNILRFAAEGKPDSYIYNGGISRKCLKRLENGQGTLWK